LFIWYGGVYGAFGVVPVAWFSDSCSVLLSVTLVLLGQWTEFESEM